jgi:hypothetical protein
MKLWLIKWVIRYLAENHYYLVLEGVLPPDTHVHRNPTKKVVAKSDRTTNVTFSKWVKYDPLVARDEAE